MVKNDLNYWRNKLKDIVSPELVDDVIVDINDIHNQQLALMAKKNKDYGNTLYEACDAIGDIYAYCRIFDKAKRFISLIKNGFNPEIKDDTLEDTIRDLANYCNMYLAWKNRYNQENKKVKHIESDKDNTVYIELYQLLCTKKLYLLDEETYVDVTGEIQKTYGFEGLYKDDDGFVYNENKDGSMVIVTNNNKRQVIAVDDNWKASNMYEK